MLNMNMDYMLNHVENFGAAIDVGEDKVITVAEAGTDGKAKAVGCVKL